MAGIRKVSRWPKAGPDDHFGIVAAKFNGEIVERLVAGAVQTLRACGVKPANILVVRVPGALEIPLAAQKIVNRGGPWAVIALGAVIKGGTDHYQHVCEGASRGLMQVMLESGVPVANGVLTVQTRAQAEERAGGQVGNKGSEAALAAVEMVNTLAELDERLWPKVAFRKIFKPARTGKMKNEKGKIKRE